MGDDETRVLEPLHLSSIWQTYKIPILLGGVSLLCIALSLVLLLKSHQASAPIEFSSDIEATVAGVMAQLTVDIEGAVVVPGVYQLPMGSRVEDAITAAGGLSNEADAARIAGSINRAAKLSDGAKLYMPKKGDGEGGTSLSSSANMGSSTAFDNLVNVNAASQSRLEELMGVGPVTAKKIIDNRPYQTLEELVSKKAMSQSLLNKLKDQLTL